MYKVFDNDRWATICHSPTEFLHSGESNALVYTGFEHFKKAWDSFWSGTSGSIKIFILPEDWERFTAARYQCIDAAGGVVTGGRNLLMIYRRGFWDLPKGKIDPGETPEEAAFREVDEECGVQPESASSWHFVTFHLYRENHREVLKKTDWYHMAVSEKAVLVPQEEEDIEAVKWVDRMSLQHYLDQSYPNIRHLCQAFLAASDAGVLA